MGVHPFVPSASSQVCSAGQADCDGSARVLRVASEDTLRRVVAKVQGMEQRGEIGEWEQVADLDSLLPEDYEPEPGQITERKQWPKMGATELRLSNGMRVSGLLDC